MTCNPVDKNKINEITIKHFDLKKAEILKGLQHK